MLFCISCSLTWGQGLGQSPSQSSPSSSAGQSAAPGAQSGSTPTAPSLGGQSLGGKAAPGSNAPSAPSSGDNGAKQDIGDAIKQGLSQPAQPSTTPLQDKADKAKPTTLSPEMVKEVLQKDQKTEEPPKDQQGKEQAPENKSKAHSNPYDSVPSLIDLYTQLSNATPDLQRFGSAIFRNGTGNMEGLPMDLPVGPDYVLGSGDGLNIDVWGSVSDNLQRVVDRQGQVTLPEVGSLQAAGRTLGEMQRALQDLLNSRFRNVHTGVSLARVRTVRVYVVGDVERPGAYNVSSMSTPLNALYAAGGPTDGGSMRTVRHYRGRKLVQEVDLYDLILHGMRSDLQRLEPGDSILVPPVAAEVRMEGMVHRPAIYELRDEHSLAEVLALAGGVLPTGTLRHIEVERVQANDKRTMLSLDLPEKADNSAADRLVQEFQVQDRDVVRIWPILPYSDKSVFLTGHVIRPGKYSYHEGMTVADLIRSSSDLLPEPAMHAEVIRLVPPEFRPVVIAFAVSPSEGKVEAIPLKPFDTIRLFGRFDFEDAPSVTIRGEVRDPGTHILNGETRLRDAVFLAGGLTSDALIGQAQVYRKLLDSNFKVFTVDLNDAMSGDATANIELKTADTVVIHSNLAKVDPATVYIHGEVAAPGQYPLSAGMTAADLVRMAGGFTRGAYKEQADLARYTIQDGKKVVGDHRTVPIGKALEGDAEADLQLQAADVLSIRKLVGWDDVGASVTLGGEVEHPGTYGIREGERLSSVIRRAGGFRPTAFPQGAVLERTQVRELAEKSRQDLINTIEAQQIVPPQYSSKTLLEDQLAMTQAMNQQRQQTLQRLRNTPASGRLVITISSNVAKWANTVADVELRAGDSIRIPKKPQFVVVSGEVYNSTAMNYSPGKTAEWYLRRAGGFTEFAHKKGVFIVAADGSVVARGSSGGLWEHSVLGHRMQPGDSLIVPEKILGGGSEAWKHILDTAQLLSSVAIAAKVATSL